MKNKTSPLAIQHSRLTFLEGGLAQLARALDLHSRGQGFDSLILHRRCEVERQNVFTMEHKKRADGILQKDSRRKLKKQVISRSSGRVH